MKHRHARAACAAAFSVALGAVVVSGCASSAPARLSDAVGAHPGCSTVLAAIPAGSPNTASAATADGHAMARAAHAEKSTRAGILAAAAAITGGILGNELNDGAQNVPDQGLWDKDISAIRKWCG
ncbi:MAG TPA: hypothetical protein VGG54_22700 [Trebonia sp.]